MISIVQYFAEIVHQKLNRGKVLAQKEETSKLYKEKHLLVAENERLEKLLYDSKCLVLEINKHIRDGGQLLGIHEFTKRGLNPELPDKVYGAYYIWDEDSDFFYLRGYVIGVSQPYKSLEPTDENYTINHVFRIDGDFLYDDFERSSCRMRVGHVDTEKPYRMLGMARQGFDYLKIIAKERKVRSIRGCMDGQTRKEDNLSVFYEKMGFDLTFTEDQLPSFKMKFHY